ncbi:MAG: RluA family pseudouridine synthase [Clostridia bacterium]|nr:RluA family pseudouridine synthase [Clostridia bacterium]
MRVLTVNKDNIKLETYLLEAFKVLNFNKLSKYLKENKIKVNGKKVPLNTQLKKGDEIKLFILDEFLEDKPLSIEKKDIVYEDDNILVAFKKAGLVTIDEDVTIDSLDRRIKTYLNTQEGSVCHRLDTGTSGLVIFAKNSATEGILLNEIKSHTLRKFYTCVTFGWPKENEGTIQNYLLKSDDGFVKVFKTKVENSKEAITKYRVLQKKNELALLDVEILTGRTHQIRAHMKSLGCPILGDSKYGNEDANRKYKKKRQCLCAYKIVLPTLTGALSNISNKTFEIDKPKFDLF